MRTVAGLAFCLLVAARLAVAQDPGPKADEPVLRAYDVGFLVVRVEDQTHPRLAGDFYRDEVGGAIVTEVESSAFLGADDLRSIIRTNFHEDSWSDARHSIEFQDGVLVVVNRLEVHEEIARYLEALRAQRGVQIALELALLELSPETFAAFDAAPATAEVLTMSPQQSAVLQSAAEGGTGARVVRAARLRCFSGQSVALHAARTEAFVRDYDVEIADTSSIADPSTSLVDDGCAVSVRPHLELGGTRISADVEFEHQVLLEGLQSFDTSIPGMGRLFLPVFRHAVVAQTVTLPIDRPALLGWVSAAPERPDGRVLALRLKATVVRTLPEPKEAPTSAERRQARTFDVRFLLRMVPDYSRTNPLEAGALWGGGDAGVSAAFYEPPEGIHLGAEALRRLVTDNVAPGSWSNVRNRIAVTDQGLLLVVQTPEVLEQVAKYIGELARDRGRVVRVEAAWLELEPNRASALGDSPGPEALQALLAAVRPDGDVRWMGRAAVAGTNRQRIFVRHTRARNYIRDHDVEIATRAQSADPIIGQAHEGLNLDVRPVLVGDGSHVLLDLRSSCQRFTHEPTDFPTGATGGGRLQLPGVDSFSFQAAPIVKDGAWALAGAAPGPNGVVRLVLVRASVGKVE